MNKRQYPNFDDYVKNYELVPQKAPTQVDDDAHQSKYPLLSDEMQQQATQTQQIDHTIQPDDTLEGLSIQYDVSMGRIKQFNKLDGDFIHHLKMIRIPNPKSNYVCQEEEKEDGEDLRRKQKINYMIKCILDESDQSVAIAKYYLEGANWEADEAAKEYKEDRQFEKLNPQLQAQFQAMAEGGKEKEKRSNRERFLSWFKKKK